MKNVIDLQNYKDEIEKAEIEKSTRLGDALAFNLMDIEPAGTDNTAILFAAWVTITIQLLIRGWSPAELRKTITSYNKIANEIKKG